MTLIMKQLFLGCSKEGLHPKNLGDLLTQARLIADLPFVIRIDAAAECDRHEAAAQLLHHVEHVGRARRVVGCFGDVLFELRDLGLELRGLCLVVEPLLRGFVDCRARCFDAIGEEKQQAERAAELPALRDTEARAAAGLQRLTNARELLDREEQRAKERVAELDRRLMQFTSDIAREQQQIADADLALQRLDTEDAELKEEIKTRVEKRSGVDERVAESEATLAASERLFSELTTALADLTAKRNQLEAGVRSHRDRLARLDQEIGNVERGEQKLAQETGGLGDLAALSIAMTTAQQNLTQAEAASQASEAAHVAARATLDAARAPLAEADKRVQRLETEARTISKLVNVETKNLWPPIIDGITVTKGYEKAIGAVLGDDLDAPVDPSAPMRWTVAGSDAGDPSLPSGVEPLAAHVQAPPELTRRLKQIGVVSKERGADHVLNRFGKRERSEIEVTLEDAADAVEMIVTDGVEAAMTKYNART